MNAIVVSIAIQPCLFNLDWSRYLDEKKNGFKKFLISHESDPGIKQIFFGLIFSPKCFKRFADTNGFIKFNGLKQTLLNRSTIDVTKTKHVQGNVNLSGIMKPQ